MADETKSWHSTPAYHEAIGRMVMIYTQAELSIKSVLFNFLGMSEVEFAILVEFGRLKVPDMATIVKKLIEQRPEYEVERRHLLIWALKAFDRLSCLRNTYVHGLWTHHSEAPALISIKSKTKSIEDPFTFVTLDELRKAESDLRDVVVVLSQFLYDANPDID